MGVMNASKSKYFLFSGILSLIGTIISFLLIREFYGTSGDFVNSLCSISSPENGCATLALSDYSGIRGLPFFGDLPIALFGFTYYGFILYLSYFAGKEPESGEDVLKVIYMLISFGFLIDIILFFIMIFVVQTICTLCISTYLVTIIIGIFSIMELKKRNLSLNPVGNISPVYIKKHTVTFLIVFLFFLTCGIGGGRLGGGSDSIASVSDQSLIQKKIEVYEKSPLLNLDLTDIPYSGSPGAPITIVKYADFNCGHCMHTSHILNQILQEYAGMVKVYYKNFPLDGNCNPLMVRKSPDSSSCIAAAASICGSKQNKFKNVYDGLYSDAEKGIRHSAVSVLDIAKRQNLNIQSFNSCMGSKEVSDSILKDVKEAEKINITSTPSLFINNRAIDPGTPDPVFLRSLLNQISKKI